MTNKYSNPSAPLAVPNGSRRWFLVAAGGSIVAAACASADGSGQNATTNTTTEPSVDPLRPRPTTSGAPRATTTVPTGADPDGSGEEESLGVAILGAGAAGLAAGHLLAQSGREFTVFEASTSIGGRMKTIDDFIDVPIPLGAEWLVEPESELAAIVADPDTDIATTLSLYDPQTPTGYYDGASLQMAPLGEFDYLNFVDGSWLDFFERHLVPSVAERLQLRTEIVSIDSTDSPVRLTDADGRTHLADQVIVTVPMAVLASDRIRFTPSLPEDKLEALAGAEIWDGIKIFLEFDEAFYPTFLSFVDSDTLAGQRTYYDATAERASDAHVLGLFAVGAAAEPYLARRGDDLRDHVLGELDEIFDGAATRSYLRHVVQNWKEEPFVGQAYLSDHADASIPETLFAPIGDQVFFAGDCYTTHGDWGSVDDAARSARDAVRQILG